jgi:CheY-like chemotaxis protein
LSRLVYVSLGEPGIARRSEVEDIVVKVLLVESNAKIQNQLVEALKKVRFEVVTTNWVSDVLSRLEDSHFDLILFRDKLEDSTAVECVSQIRKIKKFAAFPVIVIYGKMDSKHKMDAWRSGADDVVSMPFVLPELLMQLHIRLQKTNLHRDLKTPMLVMPAEKNIPSAELQGEPLPFHGLVESYSLPFCLSWIYFKQATGILRLIEGKHIRSLCIENGFIRSAHSTKKEENFHRFLLKTLSFPGETKRDFKALPETSPDSQVIETAGKLCGLQPETVDAVTVQFIQMIISFAIQSSKGEFDWAPDEKSDEFYTVGFRGIHPAKLLIQSLRVVSPAPDFSHLLTGKDLRLVPSSTEGILSETYNFNLSETSALALTAKGLSLNNWLRQISAILPYAASLIYILLVFKVFSTVERTELDYDEISAVKLPEPMDDSTSAKRDLSTEIIDDDVAVDALPKTTASDAAAHTGDSKDDDNTDVDLRPIQKRVIRTAGPGELSAAEKPANPQKAETLLERELKELNRQQTTPHRKISTPLKQHPGAEKAPVKNATPFDIYGLTEGHLSEGHTWEIHPALVITMAIKFRKTGILLFSDAASQTKLFWRNGNLLYAKTDKPVFRIDQVLFDLGIINEQQKAAAANLWDASSGMRSGTGLFKQNIVNIMELTEGVKEQIRLILQDVCNMPAGDFSFNPGELPDSEYVAFDISTERVFLQGIRNLDDLGVLERIVPSLNVSFLLAPGAIVKAQDVRLEGIDISILNRFRKESVLKAVFAGTDLGIQAFKNSIAGLALLGFLEKAGNGR